jgi:hypothetical protein
MTPTLSPHLREIADKILALREMTRTTGFQTGKTQKEILMPLSPDDLATVAQLVYQK